MTFWQAQQSLLFYQWIIRGLVIFFWLFIIVKIIGQRQVGRLTLLDFIIGITFGTIAGGPLHNSEIGLTGVFLTIGTLTLLDVIISYIALKNGKFRRVFQDEPIVLIENGKLLEDTMRKARINLSDLLMELRLNKLPDLSDTEFAILEPNGKISVIPKSQSRTVKPRDLGVKTGYEGLPTLIIEDGNIFEDNLIENDLSIDWLKAELKKQNVSLENVQAAMLGTQGRLFISKK